MDEVKEKDFFLKNENKVSEKIAYKSENLLLNLKEFLYQIINRINLFFSKISRKMKFRKKFIIFLI